MPKPVPHGQEEGEHCIGSAHVRVARLLSVCKIILSLFAKSKLSLQVILKLAYLWTRQTRVTVAAHEVKVTESVAID